MISVKKSLIHLVWILMSYFAQSFELATPFAVAHSRRGFLKHRDGRSWSACYLTISSHSRSHSRLFSTISPDDSGKKRILFLGTPEVAAQSLQTIYNASLSPTANYKIAGVVTQPPKRRKRKGKVEASPVGLVAEDLGIPVLAPEKANDPVFLDHLEREVRPDLCITAAYGQYLPKRFLAIPPCGTVNIHPSLLPRWRGASPVQRSLEAGDNPVGVSVLFTVSKMDAGPIIVQKEQTIDDENDTATTVLPLLFEIGTQCLLDVLDDVLSGKITMETGSRQQEESLVTKADMIDSAEAELKVWEQGARACHNKVRGFSMWPQTFMWLQVGDNKEQEPMKVKILKTRVVPELSEGATDIVKLGPTKSSGLYVVCYDRSVLEVQQVQPATRKAFPARDFQNGYPGETIRWIPTPTDSRSE